MLAKPSCGVLVVDLQPAYATGSGISRNLMRQTLDYVRALPVTVPLKAVHVNQELSGDTREDVLDFWRHHGANDALLSRIEWAEKPYAFLRGWMDNGVPADDIISVLRRLRGQASWDSRDLEPDLLLELSPRGYELADPLFRDEDVERVVKALRGDPAAQHWLTCGGGRDECLAEVELVLASARISFERLHHLTY